MAKWLNPEEPGREKQPAARPTHMPMGIKNNYCPYDGHYCEQPDCTNCQFEKEL